MQGRLLCCEREGGSKGHLPTDQLLQHRELVSAAIWERLVNMNIHNLLHTNKYTVGVESIVIIVASPF